MSYRRLGRAPVEVSVLGLGCMNLGGPTGEGEAHRIIDRALDAGITLFDTASAYSGGRSETILGRALGRGAKRSRVLVTTKVHAPVYDRNPERRKDPAGHIARECDASLKRLGTDYIDIYQINWPQRGGPLEPALRQMERLVLAGKIRFAGFTTITPWQVVESLWIAERDGLQPVVSQQAPYHLLDRRIERETIPMGERHGIGILAWGPLAGGFLTGKYRANAPRPLGARWETTGDEHFTPAAFRIVQGLTAIAAERGLAAGQLALSWCLAQPGISSILIGPRTEEQLEDYLGVVTRGLDERDAARLDILSPPGSVHVPYHIADLEPGKFYW